MASRLELQTYLEEILGSKNVYYQPPMSIKMKYPAIVYSRSDIQTKHADDSVYKQDSQYEAILMYRDPDWDMVNILSRLPKCSFERHYSKDNLYHDVFSLWW